MPKEAIQKRDFASTFARGLAVIQAFHPGERVLPLSTIAQRAGVDRAVARRLLLTLAELDFVRIESQRFSLTPKILRLGYSYVASIGSTATVQSILVSLSHEIREATSLAVLDELETVSIAHADAPERRMGFSMTPGLRLPVHASASGRVFLASMPAETALATLRAAPRKALTKQTLTDPEALAAEIERVREKGYALVVNELDEGLIALSLPIRDKTDKCIASLNASSNLARDTPEQFVARVLRPLQDAASDIGRTIS